MTIGGAPPHRQHWLLQAPAQQGTPQGLPMASPKVRMRIARGIPEMRQGCWATAPSTH